MAPLDRGVKVAIRVLDNARPRRQSPSPCSTPSWQPGPPRCPRPDRGPTCSSRSWRCASSSASTSVRSSVLAYAAATGCSGSGSAGGRTRDHRRHGYRQRRSPLQRGTILRVAILRSVSRFRNPPSLLGILDGTIPEGKARLPCARPEAAGSRLAAKVAASRNLSVWVTQPRQPTWSARQGLCCRTVQFGTPGQAVDRTWSVRAFVSDGYWRAST